MKLAGLVGIAYAYLKHILVFLQVKWFGLQRTLKFGRVFSETFFHRVILGIKDYDRSLSF
jgi:hypothetical protein